MNFMGILDEMGKAPELIREMQQELIAMQIRYAEAVARDNFGFTLHGIPTRGTKEQYEKIIRKLEDASYEIYNPRAIQEVLTAEEIDLLNGDRFITTDYRRVA